MERPGKILSKSRGNPRMSRWRRKKLQLEKEMELHNKNKPSNECRACKWCYSVTGVHFPDCDAPGPGEIPF